MVPEKDLRKKPAVKRKTAKISSNLSVYMFDTFDEYLEFCMSIQKTENTACSFFKKSALYLYKSKYYLCLNINQKDINLFKHLHYEIIEFASHINNSDLFERKLKEYGKVIFKTNAINNCVKHFN